MDKREQNEGTFNTWHDLPDGGRQYRLAIGGRQGWKAVYVKEVNAMEETRAFWQEIYDDQDQLVEIHHKYPVDTGHQKVREA